MHSHCTKENHSHAMKRDCDVSLVYCSYSLDLLRIITCAGDSSLPRSRCSSYHLRSVKLSSYDVNSYMPLGLEQRGLCQAKLIPIPKIPAPIQEAVDTIQLI